MRSYDGFKQRIKEVEIIHKIAKELLQSRIRSKRAHGHILIRGGVVLLSGHFEGYLRDIQIGRAHV